MRVDAWWVGMSARQRSKSERWSAQLWYKFGGVVLLSDHETVCLSVCLV